MDLPKANQHLNYDCTKCYLIFYLKVWLVFLSSLTQLFITIKVDDLSKIALVSIAFNLVVIAICGKGDVSFVSETAVEYN